ncbi:MAG: 50S ribosomal protein L25 [Firmicutes bacterium]|nr:50S ribosomal protein L25 [Bacillota bacterium]
MRTTELSAQVRNDSGKGAARRLRRAGRVPAVLYRSGQPPAELSVNARELARTVQQAGSHALVRLTVSGDAGETRHAALIKDLQRDPVSGDVLHVDFQAVALNEEVETSVPIEVTGEEGLAGQGVVNVVLREVAVASLPERIPDRLSVDVSGMAPGDAVAVRDLAVPDGVRVLNDPDEPVLSVAWARAAEPAETSAGEGAAGEVAGPEGTGARGAPEERGGEEG